MTTKGRNTTVDVLRVLAGLMVIGIHTSGEYVLEGVAEGANFIAGLCWEAVVQPAVPLFVIISGAFVLGRNETWGDFYRKRIPRLLVLLAFWLPFYWLWLWLKGDDIGSYLAGFWQGRSFVHLWYVVMLLGLYAVVPLLNEIIRRCEADGEKAARKRLWTLSTILLLLGILSNTYDYILGYNRFFPFLWPDYLGYFLVGYTLKSHAPQRSLPALSLYGLSTISLFFASRYAFEHGEGLYFYRNLSPLIVLSAISLFALFVSWRGCKVQNNVSLYSGVVCEDYVFLGPSCVFTNVINPRAFIERKSEYRPTHLHEGVSIGANATILCGITIGAYAMVGAGTVVIRDVPPYALVVGNPARRIGWVSRAGHRLSFDDKGMAVCPETGERYREVEETGTIEPVSD